MTTGRNRPGWKDRGRPERADSKRSRRPVRWIALATIYATFALGTAPAQGVTGGVSTVADEGGASTASSQTQAGEGIAFAPMRSAGATWYGPGLYGNYTACGQVLRPSTVGVAHRSLPCGTTVKFAYRGREIVTRVIDRGPFTGGNDWDLTNGTRKALRFEGSDRILYAVALSYARQRRG
jgi:rare lipoprotein A (peptidoglycan hydrolase)